MASEMAAETANSVSTEPAILAFDWTTGDHCVVPEIAEEEVVSTEYVSQAEESSETVPIVMDVNPASCLANKPDADTDVVHPAPLKPETGDVSLQSLGTPLKFPNLVGRIRRRNLAAPGASRPARNTGRPTRTVRKPAKYEDASNRLSSTKESPNPTIEYSCGECQKTFRWLSKLQKHSARVHPHLLVKKYKCGQCGSSYTQRQNLVKHERTHSGDYPFVCSICEKGFVASHDLRRHVRSAHTTIKPHKCEICPKSFAELKILNQHNKTHENVRKFKCKMCSQTFQLRQALNRHEIIHTGEKPFKCDICEKAFTQLGTLNVHVRTAHSGEKRFECGWCKKQFAKKTDAQAHKRIHTGEKPFSCSLCTKKFRSRQNLNAHQLTHSGLRKFECPVCEKRFRSKQSMIEHRYSHNTDDFPASTDTSEKYRSPLTLTQEIPTTANGLKSRPPSTYPNKPPCVPAIIKPRPPKALTTPNSSTV